MLPAIVAAITAARVQQQKQQGGVRYLPPTKPRKISKFEWALYAFVLLGVLTIIVMACLGM
jgi:hypothetical protein